LAFVALEDGVAIGLVWIASVHPQGAADTAFIHDSLTA
jgi:hypothetical protein